MAPLLTKQEAKRLICQFLTEEWPKADAEEEIEAMKITDGYSNTVHIVRRKNESVVEPAVVILRHYGGNDFDLSTWATKNSEAEETLVVSEMSAKGWGPKLYGVFAGGRVEEYIDSCTLNPQLVVSDSSIGREVARNLARFHSLQLPLAKDKFNRFRDKIVTVDSERRVALEQEIRQRRPDLLPTLSVLLDWDTRDDKKWLFQIFETEQFRKGLVIVDPNYLNILLRNDRNEGASFVVLVDYELAAYGYTAMDIGGHFILRLVQARSCADDMLTGLEFPSMEEIREFVTVYAQECRELGTLRQQDSIDSLVRETLFGCLLSTIYIADAMHGHLDMISKEIQFIKGLEKIRENYYYIKNIVEDTNHRP